MTYEMYRYIFVIAAVLCGVMFGVSVLLFSLLKIPAVIGNLSGSTARKVSGRLRKRVPGKRMEPMIRTKTGRAGAD